MREIGIVLKESSLVKLCFKACKQECELNGFCAPCEHLSWIIVSISVFLAEDRGHHRQTDTNTPKADFESTVHLTCVSLDYGRELKQLTDLKYAT